MKENEVLSKFIGYLKLALRLEKNSLHGRFNLVSSICLLIFAVFYTAREFLVDITIIISNLIKTCVLKKEISSELTSTDISWIIIPFVIMFIACLFFIMWAEYSKDKIRQRKR